MFTFDSKHTRSRYKIRAQQEQETFGVVNRRQFGANYIPVISFHSQASHVQGHFEIWKQVFTVWWRVKEFKKGEFVSLFDNVFKLFCA